MENKIKSTENLPMNFFLFFILRQILLEDSCFPERLSCLENPQNLWFMMVSFSLGYQRQYEKADD